MPSYACLLLLGGGIVVTDKPELLPCPFCGRAASIESNRGWHRLIVDHSETKENYCVLFGYVPMYAEDNENLKLMIEDWNRRHGQ